MHDTRSRTEQWPHCRGGGSDQGASIQTRARSVQAHFESVSADGTIRFQASRRSAVGSSASEDQSALIRMLWHEMRGRWPSPAHGDHRERIPATRSKTCGETSPRVFRTANRTSPDWSKPFRWCVSGGTRPRCTDAGAGLPQTVMRGARDGQHRDGEIGSPITELYSRGGFIGTAGASAARGRAVNARREVDTWLRPDLDPLEWRDRTTGGG